MGYFFKGVFGNFFFFLCLNGNESLNHKTLSHQDNICTHCTSKSLLSLVLIWEIPEELKQWFRCSGATLTLSFHKEINYISSVIFYLRVLLTLAFITLTSTTLTFTPVCLHSLNYHPSILMMQSLRSLILHQRCIPMCFTRERVPGTAVLLTSGVQNR